MTFLRRDRLHRPDSLRIFQYLLVFVAFCWTMPAWASGKSMGAAELHLLSPGVPAVADLDGDHVPDLASGTNLGRTAQGYAYRVNLDLSSNSQSQPFSVFSAEPNGINIEAIDLDGDHDLDLVITSRILQKPIGVWLNDGRGNFTRGDSDQYAHAFFKRHASLTLPGFPSQVIGFDGARRIQVVLIGNRINGPPTGVSVARVRSVRSRFSLLFPPSTRFRAPPTI